MNTKNNEKIAFKGVKEVEKFLRFLGAKKEEVYNTHTLEKETFYILKN